MTKAVWTVILSVALFPLLHLRSAAGQSRPEPDVQTTWPAEDFNAAIIAQSNRYRQGRTAEQASLLKELIRTAAARRRMLADLIERNPSEVLQLALPADAAAAMPAAVREYLEEPMELEGELLVLAVDHEAFEDSHFIYLLKTDNGQRYSIHFTRHPPELDSGSRVRASGLMFHGIRTRDAGETDGAFALESEASILTLAAKGGANGGSNDGTPAPVPGTLGEQKTLVLLVNFQDQPIEDYTINDARNIVFGTASNFFLENSYSQTWLSGDVAGWFTIALSSTVCDFDALASQADSAAQASGISLLNYGRIVYSFRNACGGKGLGTVGGNPSRAWIIGSLDPGVVAHELGHGFGLWHARSLDCGSVTIGDNCTNFAYGDPFDTMGNTGFGHFSAFQKERLNWLNSAASPPIQTVATSGIYRLASLETRGTDPSALKILKSVDPATGQRSWYYVQLRRAIGFDGFLAGNSNVLNGVLIHTGSESTGDSSYLLDLTPGSALLNSGDWRDPALTVGNSFEDPAAGLALKVDWADESGASITVLLASGTTGEPTLTISTDRQSYQSGQTVSMTAKVTSGGAPLANASVRFTLEKSNGITSTATITTGSNGIAIYNYRIKKQDPAGVYQAGASALVDGGTGSAVTTFTVN